MMLTLESLPMEDAAFVSLHAKAVERALNAGNGVSAYSVTTPDGKTDVLPYHQEKCGDKQEDIYHLARVSSGTEIAFGS